MSNDAADMPRIPTDVRPPVRCSRCEYDLSGAPLSGDCPECGTGYTLESLLQDRGQPPGRSSAARVVAWIVLTPLVLLGLGVVLLFGSCLLSMP